MRLGYNTNGLQNHRLTEALRLLADHGYEAVALTLDVQHLDPYLCTAREVQEIAALLAKLSLEPYIETGARFLLDPGQKHAPTLMTRASESRARRLDFYARAARLGRDLGAKVLSFWAGIDRNPGADSESWLDEGVGLTAELVREQGLSPALEPEPGMAVATLADYRGLCQRLEAKGAAAPALCLDVGHLHANEEGEVGKLIPAVAASMAQVHLEDARPGVHEHLLPGQGVVDFQAVRQVLQEVEYGGAICFELSRHSHMAPEALRICQEVWQAGGLDGHR